MNIARTSRRAALVALALLALPWTAAAQSRGKFPDGPVKIIVPFAPGGGVDSAARMIGRQMQASLGAPVVVDNRPGGSGTLGGRVVQTATADGQTLLFSAATHILTKLVMAAPPYDPQTDFAPVARVGEAPLLLVIAPDLAAKNLSEVLAAVRAQPDKWTAAIPALGAPSHVATLLLARQGNLKLTMAPYKGTAPALVDVAGGHAQLLLDSIISLQPMAKGGKVRPIAVTSARRSSLLPEVPTAVEAGLPGLVYTSWYGLWAPKDTPAERIAVLHRSATDAAAELAKSGAFGAAGIDPVSESIEQFRKVIAAGVAQSGDLLKASGFKPE
jgi:tripartite-type tricarboxylate transporter receptor subunit TctC